MLVPVPTAKGFLHFKLDHGGLALAFAVGCAHPACETAVEEPIADDAPDPDATPGCRFGERLLSPDERSGKWPSPNDMEAAMNREYRGHVDWLDLETDPPDDVVVEVKIDPHEVLLRYPISPPQAQERVICQSSVVVRFDVAVRLGGTLTEFSGTSATFGADVNATEPLSPPLDDYEVTLNMRFDGAAVSGRFKTRNGEYRQVGSFGAR